MTDRELIDAQGTEVHVSDGGISYEIRDITDLKVIQSVNGGIMIFIKTFHSLVSEKGFEFLKHRSRVQLTVKNDVLEFTYDVCLQDCKDHYEVDRCMTRTYFYTDDK